LIKFDNNNIRLNLWDLAGQQKFRNIHPTYYKKSIGAIAVYSRDERESAENLEAWISDYFKHSGFSDTPILVIGNKSDLEGSTEQFISEKDHEEILGSLQKKFKKSKIIGSTTSAKTGENVEDCITEFAGLCLDWIMNMQSKSSFSIDNDYRANFPAALIMTMNEMSGPLLIKTSPDMGEFNKNKLIAASINIVASMDFDDLAKFKTHIGQTPWIEPEGNLYYVAFAITNPEARGGKEMYIIGVVAKRDLQVVIDEHKSTINGYLQSGSNFFARFKASHKIDFSRKLFSHGLPDIDLKEIEDYLNNLRRNLQEAIE